MTQIHLTTLGRLRVERAGEEVRELPGQPVRCALLVYLALERRATRDELAALLWPDRDGERARRSLNQTLYELRQVLGEDWLRSSRERVEVTDALTADALRFADAVREARDGEALALYGGEFLQGCHLSAAEGFEMWIGQRRAELARLHRDVCRRATAARRRAGDAEGALAAARRWAEVEPLEDEAHHQIIEILAESGRRAEALQHYEEYARLIARELQVEPLDETLALVTAIRTSTAGGPAGFAGAATPPVDEQVRRASSDPADHPAAPVPLEAGPSAPAERAPVDRWAFARWQRGSARRRRRALFATIAVTALAGALAWAAAGDPLGGWPGGEPRLAEGIAVLPFENLSSDPKKEYLSDGITEDLLTHLSRLPDLRVISRTSVMRYKDGDTPATRIARELDVRYILEGSVRQEGDRVRVTAQLIDGERDAHLWAETFDRELTGIFDLQEEIARSIARQLQHRLVPAERERIAGGGTADVAAYDLVLRGREYLNRPGAADRRKFAPAMAFFRQALEVAPGYARAHVGLSVAFRNQVALPIAVRRDSALAHAARAVELDPGSAEAGAALGDAYLIGREWERAESEFARALHLEPNRVEARAGLARLAWVRGRLDEAVGHQREAVRLDPFSAGRLATLGSFLFDIGDLPAAERVYRRAAELAPDSPANSFMVAQLALLRGDPDAAERQMRKLELVATDHPGTHFLLGRFHAQRGRYAEASARLARAEATMGAGPVATISLQRAYVARKLGQELLAAELIARAAADLDARDHDPAPFPRLQLQLHGIRGEAEPALELLRRREPELGSDLLAGPQIGLYRIEADPLLENLRSDPRFVDVLARLRLDLDSMRFLID